MTVPSAHRRIEIGVADGRLVLPQPLRSAGKGFQVVHVLQRSERGEIDLEDVSLVHGSNWLLKFSIG